MGKRTKADDRFVQEFARKLRVEYDACKKEGVRDDDFALSIGVKRASLQRYLRGATMPEHGSIVLAYRKYGILVRYAASDPAPLLVKSKRETNMQQLSKDTDETTLLRISEREHPAALPFSIRAQAIDLKIRPAGTTGVDLGVTIRKLS